MVYIKQQAKVSIVFFEIIISKHSRRGTYLATMGNTAASGSVTSSNNVKDVIYGSTLPLSLSTRDERVEISSVTSVPYSWICRLIVETQQGHKYSATGFKITVNKPTVQHQVILTSAHSVFIEGALAKKVTVMFPGQCSITVPTKNLWASKEFIQTNSPDYDYGVVMIPGNSEEGFNWTTMLSDDELTGRPLSCCGYSTDKDKGSLWITGGGVENVTSNTIQYMYDSRSTSSGSVVYTWHKGYWTAVGVQSYSGNLNLAIKINVEMIRNVMKAVGYPIQYSIQSKEYLDTYLYTHMNMLDIDKEEEIVTIGYQSAGKIEPQRFFEIIPLSSVVPVLRQAHQLVCVSPSPCKDVYLGLTKNSGHVTVDTTVCGLYLYCLDGGCIALESVSEPGLYLSLSDVLIEESSKRRVSVIESGNTNKVICCHFVPEKCEIRSTEKFVLHRSSY